MAGDTDNISRMADGADVNYSVVFQMASSSAVFDNDSDVYFYPHHPITKVIDQYTMPVICVFGIITNTLASIVFLQKPLRNSSCSIFLAVRGIADNGFLSTLMLIWISSTFELHLSKVLGLCKINVFLTYVCGYISVWLVVFVTAENYIRICRPFIVDRVCRTLVAKVMVIILLILAIGSYNFPFWAMNQDCSPKVHFYDTVQGIVYADTALTLVIPTACITILMVVIVYNLIKSYNRRRRMRCPCVNNIQNPMAKVTKMLLAVTVTFFCLNLPAHVIRIRLMIKSFLNGYSLVSQRDEAMQKIALLVYYMSLSINVIVYLLFGSKFRKVFKDTFLKTSSGQSRRDLDVTKQETPQLRKTFLKSFPSPIDLSKDGIVCELVPLNGIDSE